MPEKHQDKPDRHEARLTILAVDDEEVDAETLRRQLLGVPQVNLEFLHAPDADAALDALRRGQVDMIFLDYRLGAESGIDLLRRIREGGDMRPVIVLTGQGNEYVAVELIRAGADDYLVKSDLTPAALWRAINCAQAQFQQRRAEREIAARNERIEHLSRQLVEANIQLAQTSRIDFLTQILTRAAWAESAALEHQRSLRHRHNYCILMIDVDRFKQYNDTLGHQQGDACLLRVAQTIGQTCRCFDLVGRYGGEEFVVLAPETDLEGGIILADRIREAVSEARMAHPAAENGRVTVSIGVSDGPPASGGWEAAVQLADEALYKAKQLGRDRVCVSEPPGRAGAPSA